VGAIPPVSEPAIGASGVSRESRLYNASANSRSSTRLSVQLPAPMAVDPAESVSRMAQANASFG
jgi:hypothetical protein